MSRKYSICIQFKLEGSITAHIQSKISSGRNILGTKSEKIQIIHRRLLWRHMEDFLDISLPSYTGKALPTNQENWPNVFPYMALYWANVLAIVPTLGQFFWFVGLIWNGLSVKIHEDSRLSTPRCIIASECMHKSDKKMHKSDKKKKLDSWYR